MKLSVEQIDFLLWFNLGDDPFNYCVIMLNIWSYGLYWAFGLTLMTLQYFNIPKSFHKYKIQQDKNSLEDVNKLMKVMLTNYLWHCQGSHLQNK